MQASRKTRRTAAALALATTIAGVAGAVIAPAANAATAVKAKEVQVTGNTVNTRFGPVQVTAKVKIAKNGTKTVTGAAATQYPNADRKSQAINSRAIPALQQQAVINKNGTVDGVSGASYTSGAFQQSLQSAIAKAK